MDSKPRMLLIGPPPGHLNGVASAADIVESAPDPVEVSLRLREGGIDAVMACPQVMADLLDRFRRDELIVGHIDKGLAVLDASGRITWANAAFQTCAKIGDDPVGKPFFSVLGGNPIASLERIEGKPNPVLSHPADPLDPARHGRPTSLRLHCPNHTPPTFLEVDLRPVADADGTVNRLIALVRDISSEVIQQQKLDALHAAG